MTGTTDRARELARRIRTEWGTLEDAISLTKAALQRERDEALREAEERAIALVGDDLGYNKRQALRAALERKEAEK